MGSDGLSVRDGTPFSVTVISLGSFGSERTVPSSSSPSCPAFGGCCSSLDHAATISSRPSSSSGCIYSASAVGAEIASSVNRSPRSNRSRKTGTAPSFSVRSVSDALCAGAVILTSHSVAAVSAAKTALRTIRRRFGFCIVHHPMGQTYAKALSDMLSLSAPAHFAEWAGKVFPHEVLTPRSPCGILDVADIRRCGGIGRHRGLKIPR